MAEYLNSRKPKVLIVDDEGLILLGWEYTLKEAGYEVVTAINGEEAMQVVVQMRPDLVITDLIMSGIDGVKLCSAIRQICPDTEVVLISGHPEQIEKYQQRFIEAGGRAEVLRKPLLRDEIIEAVESILQGKK